MIAEHDVHAVGKELWVPQPWGPAAIVVAVALLLAGGCAGRAGGVGEGLSEDERITAEVVRILEEDEDIVAADLEVETTSGVVVITGFQSELEPVREMLRRVARVRGVMEVVNRIRIQARLPATGT